MKIGADFFLFIQFLIFLHFPPADKTVNIIHKKDSKADGNGLARHTADLYLTFAAFVRIFQPRNERNRRHRQGHSDIGYHFAVIAKGIGNDAVHYAENSFFNFDHNSPFSKKCIRYASSKT